MRKQTIKTLIAVAFIFQIILLSTVTTHAAAWWRKGLLPNNPAGEVQSTDDNMEEVQSQLLGDSLLYENKTLNASKHETITITGHHYLTQSSEFAGGMFAAWSDIGKQRPYETIAYVFHAPDNYPAGPGTITASQFFAQPQLHHDQYRFTLGPNDPAHIFCPPINTDYSNYLYNDAVQAITSAGRVKSLSESGSNILVGAIPFDQALANEHSVIDYGLFFKLETGFSFKISSDKLPIGKSYVVIIGLWANARSPQESQFKSAIIPINVIRDNHTAFLTPVRNAVYDLSVEGPTGVQNDTYDIPFQGYYLSGTTRSVQTIEVKSTIRNKDIPINNFTVTPFSDNSPVTSVAYNNYRPIINEMYSDMGYSVTESSYDNDTARGVYKNLYNFFFNGTLHFAPEQMNQLRDMYAKQYASNSTNAKLHNLAIEIIFRDKYKAVISSATTYITLKPPKIEIPIEGNPFGKIITPEVAINKSEGSSQTVSGSTTAKTLSLNGLFSTGSGKWYVDNIKMYMPLNTKDKDAVYTLTYANNTDDPHDGYFVSGIPKDSTDWDVYVPTAQRSYRHYEIGTIKGNTKYVDLLSISIKNKYKNDTINATFSSVYALTYSDLDKIRNNMGDVKIASFPIQFVVTMKDKKGNEKKHTMTQNFYVEKDTEDNVPKQTIIMTYTKKDSTVLEIEKGAPLQAYDESTGKVAV